MGNKTTLKAIGEQSFCQFCKNPSLITPCKICIPILEKFRLENSSDFLKTPYSKIGLYNPLTCLICDPGDTIQTYHFSFCLIHYKSILPILSTIKGNYIGFVKQFSLIWNNLDIENIPENKKIIPSTINFDKYFKLQHKDQYTNILYFITWNEDIDINDYTDPDFDLQVNILKCYLCDHEFGVHEISKRLNICHLSYKEIFICNKDFQLLLPFLHTIRKDFEKIEQKLLSDISLIFQTNFTNYPIINSFEDFFEIFVTPGSDRDSILDLIARFYLTGPVKI